MTPRKTELQRARERISQLESALKDLLAEVDTEEYSEGELRLVRVEKAMALLGRTGPHKIAGGLR
jgi:hypothetical protein